MSKIYNGTPKDIAGLGHKFLRNVIKNMRNASFIPTVKFGVTGIGMAPNYQITFSNGTVLTYSGMTHDRFPHPTPGDKFNEDNLSQEYSYEEIQSYYR